MLSAAEPVARQKTIHYFFPLFLADEVSSFDQLNQIEVSDSLYDVNRIIRSLETLPIYIFLFLLI
jgi:hypothetical protein